MRKVARGAKSGSETALLERDHTLTDPKYPRCLSQKKAHDCSLCVWPTWAEMAEGIDHAIKQPLTPPPTIATTPDACERFLAVRTPSDEVRHGAARNRFGKPCGTER